MILAVIAGVILLFGFVVMFGAPYVPTLRSSRDDAMNLLGDVDGQRVLDMGAGAGPALCLCLPRLNQTIPRSHPAPQSAVYRFFVLRSLLYLRLDFSIVQFNHQLIAASHIIRTHYHLTALGYQRVATPQDCRWIKRSQCLPLPMQTLPRPLKHLLSTSVYTMVLSRSTIRRNTPATVS